MTDRNRPSSRVCSACRGFASVAITLGGRERHGHRRTVTANCSTCHGTGTVGTTRLRESAHA
ncbi:hypothetical protein [Streptomyces enissocaesilis]|uniref:hypothetical protein n=1 Tax=Streptomyces enissocaesilis TaxID=332589 RepID=UPI0031D0D6E1